MLQIQAIGCIIKDIRFFVSTFQHTCFIGELDNNFIRYFCVDFRKTWGTILSSVRAKLWSDTSTSRVLEGSQSRSTYAQHSSIFNPFPPCTILYVIEVPLPRTNVLLSQHPPLRDVASINLWGCQRLSWEHFLSVAFLFFSNSSSLMDLCPLSCTAEV